MRAVTRRHQEQPAYPNDEDTLTEKVTVRSGEQRRRAFTCRSANSQKWSIVHSSQRGMAASIIIVSSVSPDPTRRQSRRPAASQGPRPGGRHPCDCPDRLNRSILHVVRILCVKFTTIVIPVLGTAKLGGGMPAPHSRQLRADWSTILPKHLSF